ncbi:unnamed protein product [Closterium sp. NIES-53]
MTLRPSTAPQHVPLPSPPASSLHASPDPESDSLRAASLAVTRLLATAVTDPLFESFAASALVTELVDFAAACRLDYAASLVASSVSVCPPSVGGECALGTDNLEDRQEEFECFAASVPHLVSMLLAPEGDPDAPDIPTPRSYAEAIEGPYSSQWQAAMEAEMASWKSTGTYVDEVPPPRANIVSGMWIFRVKRLPGSPPAFKAHYVARGFSERQGVDFFQNFSPTPKMTTLRVLLHVAAQRDYELHSLDFSTVFLQGSLHEEIWLRRPPGFIGSFPAGTQWSLRRPVYGLRQAPREWHDTLRTTLASLGFAPSTADPSLFLRTDTTLPPFYVFVYIDDLVFATADTEALAHVKSKLQKRHTCTDLGELTSYLGLRITRDRAQRTITLTQSHMVQQSVEPSGPYLELVGCLMYLMTCTRPDLAYPLSLLARYVALGRHRKVHWDAAKRVLRYLCSTLGMGLVLGGRARVVLTGHADTSWVDDLATQRSSQGYTFSLGSGSVSWQSTRSSSVLSSSCEAEIYAGAMAAQELRWLTYLLTDLGEAPRSPPQRGQLRLAYVASQANTADVFTKALQPCDHQPVQMALKACRMKADAGFQAWQFNMRTYMAKDDLYIGKLEQALTNLEMGEHESATSYCNHAQQILVNLRMAGVDYSQATYITHVVKGLLQQYNLLRRMLKLPHVRKELDEDTLTSYIVEEECTLAAEGRKDQFLPQANQVFTKKGKPQFQQTSSPSHPTTAQQHQPKHGGGFGEGGEKWKGAKDGQSKRGKGGFKGNCYVCGQPGHIAKYYRQRADKEADKGGEGSRGSSASGKGGDGSKGSGQSSCAMVKPVIEHPPPVMLEPEAGEGLQAVAATVKANPSAVLLDSKCSHHLMGDRSAFVEMSSGGSIKHASLLSAGQLRDSGVQLLDAEDATLLRAPDGSLLGCAEFKGRVLCTNFQPCSTQQQEGETCKTTVKALHTDRGGEFLGHDFTLFLDKKGIIHDLTCPYTPEQNGMAEREMCSIVEAVRTLLLHMGVQHHWWHLALSQAVWVRSRVEHASLPSGLTPYELAFRRKPDVSMVRTLEEEVEEEEVVAPPAMPYVPTSVPTPPPTVLPSCGSSYRASSILTPLGYPSSSCYSLSSSTLHPSCTCPTLLFVFHGAARWTITAPPLRRSTRITRGVPLVKYAWAVVIETAGLDDEEEDEEWTDLDPDVVADPERQWDIAKMTVKEALGCWKGDKVKEAMDEEMRSLIEQGTWELVPRPPGVNVIKNRKILSTKFRPDGIVEREKARLVVKGFK